MKKKICMSVFLLFWSTLLCLSQTRQINGVVIDKNDKSPLPGVSIVVKGSISNGTATDINGKFTLKAKDDDVLVVTFIGMNKQEIVVKGQSDITIQLESSTESLDEVIVVAYGASKKSSLTGSVSSIKSDALDKLPVTSFEKALQGLSPGLQIASTSGQPGAPSQVRIRGIGSMSASSTPLYVIDGVPVSTSDYSSIAETGTNPLANLNPNDIESISILKDASAASLYGSRAANGVIMITTKQGTKGNTQVNFKAQISSSRMPSNGYDLMDGSEHYALYYDGFLAQNLTKGMSADVASVAANSATQAIYGRNPYNTANPLGPDGQLTSGSKLMIDNSWMDEIFRTALTQEYNLSVNGGSEKVKYFLSLGYLDQEGICIGSDFERYAGRVNVSSDVKPWFSMGINTTFSVSNQNTPIGSGAGASPLANALNVPNVVPIYDLDANFNKQYDANGKVLYNFKNPVYLDMNPIAFSEMDKHATKTYRVLVNPYINLKFLEGLNWKTTISYDYINLDETNWMNPEHGSGSSLDGSLSKYATWNITKTLTSTLNYNFSLADRHNFNLLAGYEAMMDSYSYTSAAGSNFPAGGLVELSVAATPKSVGSMKDKETMVSYFGRINYDYSDKYYLSLSLRSDGSSRFAPGHQFGTFWSAGVSWRAKQEEFLQKTDWLSDLKLRLSYGTSGNKSGSSLYGWQGLYAGGANYNGKGGIVHSQLPNKDLTWESSNNLNAGIDFALWSNRLSGSIEYYLKKSDKLLLAKTLPYSSGLNSIMSNLGGMKNAGVEIDLKSVNIDNKQFVWNTSFNISFNKNEITSYPQKEEIVGSTIRTVGYNIYEFYMQEWAGVDPENGDPLWYKDVLDSNGDPTGQRETTSKYATASRYKSGSSLPTCYGGFNNTLTYKGFDLSFLFTYSFGGKIYDGYMSYMTNDGNITGYQVIKDQANHWTPENRNAPNPRFVPNNTSSSNSRSTRFLYDADFIKLKNINLGYNLPKSLTKKIYLENVRVFGSFENILVWNLDPDFKGYDVELAGVSGMLSGGGTIPLPKTFVFGINIGF